jgi:hypothetical protein
MSATKGQWHCRSIRAVALPERNANRLNGSRGSLVRTRQAILRVGVGCLLEQHAVIYRNRRAAALL